MPTPEPRSSCRWRAAPSSRTSATIRRATARASGPYDTIIALDDRADGERRSADSRDRQPRARHGGARSRSFATATKRAVTVKLAERPGREREPATQRRAGAGRPSVKAEPDGSARASSSATSIGRRAERLEIPEGDPRRARDESRAAERVVRRRRRARRRAARDQPPAGRDRPPTIAGSRATAHAGDVLALYLYFPDLDQRRSSTVRVEDR